MIRFIMIFLIFTFVGCSLRTENKATNIAFEITPDFILIIDQYDAKIKLSEMKDYNYVICSTPWSNNKICITASLPESPPENYLFYLDYNSDKKIFFVTGLEGLLKKTNTNGILDQSDFIIFDPPVLCFEKTSDRKFVECVDKDRCWHCTFPPPPPDEPTILLDPDM